ncbi:hypothetical protein IY145_00810 [Methylosinus sp. H3A]|uniref:hypothetical protein n=1 Tax=Methylosinus sp. H3A TaxID=2785786 RepID=UPI0018C2D0DA|nr:hypothetical protein [Methylosinus sp. H3A]MBG0807970.1 hypothetical protein [Methylosinus sp. H3A]
MSEAMASHGQTAAKPVERDEAACALRFQKSLTISESYRYGAGADATSQEPAKPRALAKRAPERSATFDPKVHRCKYLHLLAGLAVGFEFGGRFARMLSI